MTAAATRSPLRSFPRHFSRHAGFTLVEALVAIAIMGLSLSLLYQILGGNTQSVGVSGQYQRAAMLAQSLLNAHEGIPKEGWSEQGESAGFVWQVQSQPYDTALMHSGRAMTPLHQVDILVQWSEGGQARSLAVSTLKPERFIPIHADEGM